MTRVLDVTLSQETAVSLLSSIFGFQDKKVVKQILNSTVFPLVNNIKGLHVMKSLRIISLTLISFLFLTLSACSGIFDVKGIRPSLAVDAAMDLGKSITMSDDEVKDLAKGFANDYDRRNRVAPPNSSYARRLNALVKNHTKEDGLDLNYKVYLANQVNAFAMADGTIRFYSGLMDMMNDDELLFILGHEIGHVQHGHIAKATKLSAAASGVRKGVASTSSVAGDVAATAAGGLLEKLVNMQFSQSQEYEADEYGVNFMKRHGYNVDGAITSFNKLAKLERKGGTFANLISSHPTSKKRADALAKIIGDDSKVKFAEISDDDASVDAEPSVVVSNDSDMPSEAKGMTSGQVASQEGELRGEQEIEIASSHSDDMEQYPRRASSHNKVNKVTSQESAGGDGWYIQVLASTDKSGAYAIIKKLKDLGFSSSEQVVTVRGSEYHRVLVGPFSSKIEAEDGIQNVRDAGVSREMPFIRYVSDEVSDKRASVAPHYDRKNHQEERLSQLR